MTSAPCVSPRVEKFMRTVLIVTLVAICVLGVFSFIALISMVFSPFRLVLSVYLIAFSFLGLFAELNCKFITVPFTFLTFRGGRAFFYIFIGTLGASFGPSNSLFQFIGGILLLVCGVYQAIMAFIMRNESKAPADAQQLGDEHVPADGTMPPPPPPMMPNAPASPSAGLPAPISNLTVGQLATGISAVNSVRSSLAV